MKEMARVVKEMVSMMVMEVLSLLRVMQEIVKIMMIDEGDGEDDDVGDKVGGENFRIMVNG